MMDAVIQESERLLIIRRILLGEICTLVASFYADNGLIAARDPKTLQTTADILFGLFDRVCLQTNTRKTTVMTFVPGKIWTSLSDTTYHAQMDRTSAAKARAVNRKMECCKCGTLLVAGLMAGHMAK